MSPSKLSDVETDKHVMTVRALQGLDKFNIEKDIAAFIKKEFDRKHGPTWHCIVGRNFGALYAVDIMAVRCIGCEQHGRLT